MMQFQTRRELWRLSYDAREMRFTWLETTEEEQIRPRPPLQAGLTEEQKDAFLGWTVKASVTVAIADLEDVVEVRTAVEIGEQEYHRLQVAVVLTGGRRIFLFSDVVGVNPETPWRDSREERVVLAGVAALQEEIRGLIKG
jgi:hypothetical protein